MTMMTKMMMTMMRLMKVNETMTEVVESEDSIQHWERVLALADLMLRWLLTAIIGGYIYDDDDYLGWLVLMLMMIKIMLMITSIQHWERVLALADLMLRWLLMVMSQSWSAFWLQIKSPSCHPDLNSFDSHNHQYHNTNYCHHWQLW